MRRVVIGAAVGSSLALLLLACQPVSAQDELDEFSFDPEEFKKPAWSVDGYFQGDLGFARLNSDAAFYRISFLGKEPDTHRLQGGGEILPGLTFQKGAFTARALGSLQYFHDGEEGDSDFALFEANLSWKAGYGTYLTIGKTLLRWGKGYAWNPTNFVGRIKNPSDPDLALEGYWLGLVDVVKSFNGPLRTVALTGLVLPVSEDINGEFGRQDHTNLAGKLYFLLYDTDIDLMALSEGSRAARYGVAASRNIAANFEVHGEFARVSDFEKRIVGPDGIVTSQKYDTSSYLAGVRYLARTNTTWIFEYYHNGKGYTKNEVEDFFGFIGGAQDSQLLTALADASGYLLPNFMRNYLFLRASQREPFGWLYVAPAIFTIVNVDDGSFNLVPEVIYTGVQNLELRTRLNMLFGGVATEYGDKVNDWRIEFRLRYFF